MEVQKELLSKDIESAEFFMRQKNWDKAISKWNHILNSYAQYPEGVKFRLSKAYMFNFDFDDARDILSKIPIRADNKSNIENYKSLIDSEQAKKYTISFRDARSKRSYHIDSLKSEPKIQKHEMLKNYRFKGWVKLMEGEQAELLIVDNKQEKIVEINKVRKDVKQHYKNKGEPVSLHCGFDCRVDFTRDAQIFLKQKGQDPLLISKVGISKRTNILEGKDKWLFLTNDANDSTGQFTGKIKLAEEQQRQWRKYADKIVELTPDTQLIYMVANSKEKVHPDKYPYEQGEITVTEQVESIFKEYDFDFINPVNKLKVESDTYYKTDTHWSGYGAFVAFNFLLEKINCPLSDSQRNFDFSYNERVFGDLGSKSLPPMSTRRKDINFSNKNIGDVRFSNKLPGTCSIDVFENSKFIYDKSIVIFGDSAMSAGGFKYLMSHAFRRVVCVNLPGSLIKELIDHEKPDYVLMLTTERYLRNPQRNFLTMAGAPFVNYFGKVKNKDQLAKFIQSFDNEVFYRDTMLKILSNVSR